MTARKGDLIVYPPSRPDMPFVAFRFSGYGLHSAGVAKSEQAARAMIVAHEQEETRQAAANPPKGD